MNGKEFLKNFGKNSMELINFAFCVPVLMILIIIAKKINAMIGVTLIISTILL